MHAHLALKVVTWTEIGFAEKIQVNGQEVNIRELAER